MFFARCGFALANLLLASVGCGSAGQEPATAPKVEEPPFAEFKPTGNRYRRQYAGGYVEYELTPEKMAWLQAAYAKDPRNYLGAVDPEKKYYRDYWIEDEWRMQEGRWFDKWAKDHWLPPGDIGEFKKMAAGGGLSIILRSGHREYRMSCRYHGPDKADFYISAVYRRDAPYRAEAPFFESILDEVQQRNRTPERQAEGENCVVVCKGISGYLVCWPVAERMFVDLATTGHYPKEVVREWLKLFPSSLPKDWEWEKERTNWAQSYLEYILWRMTVKLPMDFGTDASAFDGDARHLNNYFATGLGPYHRPGEAAYKVPEKAKIWNNVVDWANSARGRLEWDAKLKKLRIDEAKPRLPDKWEKLDPATVKGESELPKVDPTADYPEYKETDDKARKSWEQALQGKEPKGPGKNQEKK